MKKYITLWLLVLALAAGSIDSAGASLPNTALVDAAPTVKIDCDAAEIRIVSWLSDRVTVKSTGSEGTLFRTSVDHGNTVVFHQTSSEQNTPQDILPVVHTFYVPANATIELFLATGNITIDGSFANLSVNVDRGNIALHNVGGTNSVQTAFGGVTREDSGSDAIIESAVSL